MAEPPVHSLGGAAVGRGEAGHREQPLVQQRLEEVGERRPRHVRHWNTGTATGQLGAVSGAVTGGGAPGTMGHWGLQFGGTSSVSHDLSQVCESVTALFGNQVAVNSSIF